MKRKICVVTGTRADYGLLRWVMDDIQKEVNLELQLVATGMHMSPEFGLTYREIENDGFFINRKVEILLSADTPSGLAKSIGLGVIGFGDVLQQLQPDLMLVLGDRFEVLSAVIASMIARIPVAHLSGGETTEGVIDESIRHSITKMSHLHFVALEEYRKRVIQLGEQPERVFLVGGLGIDNIYKLSLMKRTELENSLGFKFKKKNLLITFHPATLEKSTSQQQMSELLAALQTLQDTRLIFTMPNADTDSRILKDMILEFSKKYVNAHAFTSLGQLRYLSCLQYVDAVVGNSSSGLTEVPSFKKGTVNIGDRQKGRVKPESVIDCGSDRMSIGLALKKVYSYDFQMMLKTVNNPYDLGGASDKIVKVIQGFSLENILKKSFYDFSS